MNCEWINAFCKNRQTKKQQHTLSDTKQLLTSKNFHFSHIFSWWNLALEPDHVDGRLLQSKIVSAPSWGPPNAQSCSVNQITPQKLPTQGNKVCCFSSTPTVCDNFESWQTRHYTFKINQERLEHLQSNPTTKCHISSNWSRSANQDPSLFMSPFCSVSLEV